MPLSFKYTTTLADYENFDQATMNYLTAGDVNRNRQFTDQVYGLVFIILFLGVVTIIAAILQVSFNIFSFALGIVFYIFITRYKVRQIRNKVTPRPDCSLFGENQMILNEESFTINTVNSTSTFNWKSVTGIQENDSYFFIFLDNLRGAYIPKRDLVSEELVQKIRTYMGDRVKK